MPCVFYFQSYLVFGGGGNFSSGGNVGTLGNTITSKDHKNPGFVNAALKKACTINESWIGVGMRLQFLTVCCWYSQLHAHMGSWAASKKGDVFSSFSVEGGLS